MTEISLGRRRTEDQQFSEVMDRLISMALMVFGAIFALVLLYWAVDQKLHKVRSAQLTTVSDATVEVRERQLRCLAQNIYYEAGREPFEGKVAVAQVVMNRVASGDFPSDICRVIYQKNIVYEKVLCQFSWVCDRTVQIRPVHAEAYDESMQVAKKVLLEGFRLPSLKDAMYFHADYINPGWKHKKVAHIGRHIFYE